MFVVLLDAQVGLVVQQAVEHVGRVAHADVDHFCVKRRILVGDMGVEGSSRTASILRVDMASAFCLAASSEILAVRR
ncbi:MAG: hypothetical protein QOH96_2393 [Blastocatellia bacterium]|nr:hypothetical protein [Blastocatellia bacterium]